MDKTGAQINKDIAKKDVAKTDAIKQVVTIPEKYKADILKWKAKYGKIFYLNIETDDGIKTIFFRQPTRTEYVAMEALSVDADGEIDYHKRSQKLIVDNYIGGDLTDTEILADTEIYITVSQFCLTELVKLKKTIWGSC